VDLSSLNLAIELKYTTSSGAYSYSHSCIITSGLPLSVGVTDAFRPKTLISIFAVHCTTSPLRILNVQLDSDKPFDVWSGSPSKRDLVCVPNSPAKFVYQITKMGTQEEVASSVSQGHPLTFVISYRLIEKEIETILRKRLKDIIRQKGEERLAFRLYDVLPDIVKRVDTETYGLFRAIVLNEGNEWEEAFSDASQEDRLTVKDIASQFFDIFKDYEPTEDDLSTIPLDTISIPADIPSIDVVYKVSISLKRDKEKFVVGMPIQAELFVSASFNWNLTGSTRTSPIESFYNILLDPDVWLISGSRRGHFSVENEQPQTFVCTLVPLKNGVVRIPKVEIEVLTPNVTSEIEDNSLPDIVVLPTRFTAVYKVEVPEPTVPLVGAGLAHN